MKNKTILERYSTIKLENKIEVPWNVWTMFGDKAKNITIAPDAICLGEDYKKVDEIRKGLAWYVEQFGGTVIWGSYDDKT